jgi:enamine deaminase RidA (YjgF/YER057c/UK114 family)
MSRFSNYYWRTCTMTYRADLADFAAFNRIYETYFDGVYPARTTIGCQLNNILSKWTARPWWDRAHDAAHLNLCLVTCNVDISVDGRKCRLGDRGRAAAR